MFAPPSVTFAESTMSLRDSDALIRVKTGSKNSLAPPQKESEIQAADARPQPSLTLINEALDHSEQ
jgi:hypothetical protein